MKANELNDDEILRMAQVIKEYCEEHDVTECKYCIFNNGYGHAGCNLKGDPEVWRV